MLGLKGKARIPGPITRARHRIQGAGAAIHKSALL